MKNKNNSNRKSLSALEYTPAEQVIAIFQQAENLLAAGDYAAASELFLAIISEDKKFYPALRQLGISELRQGNVVASIKRLQKYTKFVPEDALAHANLAQAYLLAAELSSAKQQINKAIAQEKNPDYYFLGAAIEEQMGAFGRAANLYSKGLAIDPQRHSAKLALATAYKNDGNFLKADEILTAYLETEPDNHLALTNLGILYHTLGAFEMAVACFSQAIDRKAVADSLYNQGLSYLQLRESKKSISAFTHALRLDPDHLEAKIQLAETFSSIGDFAKGISLLDEIKDNQTPYCRAAYLKSQIQNFQNVNDDISTALAQRVKTEKVADNIVLLNFALAKIYDDNGRYDLAFKHAQQANKTKFKSAKKAASEYIAELKNADAAIELPDKIDLDESTNHPSPIFIVGMPRSGTTLLEKRIGSTSSIAPCGELNYFEPALYRYKHGLAEFRDRDGATQMHSKDLQRLRQGYLDRARTEGPQAKNLIDKTPDNFKYFRLLSTLFPKARFIHCRRNPLDTCLSLYFQLFDGLPYSYDLRSIAQCYLTSRHIINQLVRSFPDQWLVIDYEDLVLDPTSTSRTLESFLDIESLQLDQATSDDNSPINTMSKWQARQAPYQSSINRWKNYEKQLSGLIHDLRDALEEETSLYD